MKIELEQKDTETHKWHPVATFRFAHMAVEAGRAFSKWDQHVYRVVDKRWPNEGDEITIIRNGEVQA
jgi:hypothetical protein